MRISAWMLAGALALPPVGAVAADPTGSSGPTWARWQGRLSLGMASSALRSDGASSTSTKLSTASLMGDYYFGQSLSSENSLGGFRATSGLIFGSRSLSNTGSPGMSNGRSLSFGTRAYGALPAATVPDPYSDNATQPYLGVGYTGASPGSGLSFSADFGLLARTNLSNAARASLASQSLDDAIRQMRMTPLLQLGVSFSY